MIKKILCLLFALSLCAVFPAAAEESSPLPVTAQELSALLQSVRAQVLDTEPLNDPSEENSRSEDGILLLYETAYLYAEDTRLTAETPVNALVFKQGEGPVLRDTGLDSMLDDVLAAYPLEMKPWPAPGRTLSCTWAIPTAAALFTAGSSGTDSGSPPPSTARFSRKGMPSAIPPSPIP